MDFLNVSSASLNAHSSSRASTSPLSSPPSNIMSQSDDDDEVENWDTYDNHPSDGNLYIPYTSRRTVRICSGCGERSDPGLVSWSIRLRHASIIEYWWGTPFSSVKAFTKDGISFSFIDAIWESREGFIVILFWVVFLRRVCHRFRLSVRPLAISIKGNGSCREYLIGSNFRRCQELMLVHRALNNSIQFNLELRIYLRISDVHKKTPKSIVWDSEITSNWIELCLLRYLGIELI